MSKSINYTTREPTPSKVNIKYEIELVVLLLSLSMVENANAAFLLA